MTVSHNDKAEQPKNPRDIDAKTADRIEKNPKEKESPQQTHDDEDQG
jgi:hypothetical protein